LEHCRSKTEAKATGPYQTKRAAEGLAEKTLRPLSNGVLVPESTMTLNRFMQTVYLPHAARQKRRSTFIGYRDMWKRYIKPDGDRALCEFRAFERELLLLSIARRFRQSHPANSGARECDHHNQYLREDGHAGCAKSTIISPSLKPPAAGYNGYRAPRARLAAAHNGDREK
jgi:hypothetical protein